MINHENTEIAAQNCWEYYQCPAERSQICSAFMKKAGRKCWLVAGTLCEGRIQSAHAMKIGGCIKCDFYIRVQAEQV